MFFVDGEVTAEPEPQSGQTLVGQARREDRNEQAEGGGEEGHVLPPFCHRPKGHLHMLQHMIVRRCIAQATSALRLPAHWVTRFGACCL